MPKKTILERYEEHRREVAAACEADPEFERLLTRELEFIDLMFMQLRQEIPEIVKERSDELVAASYQRDPSDLSTADRLQEMKRFADREATGNPPC